MSGEPLVCPSCASTHGLDQRFCPRCGMPLVYAGRTGVDEPITARHERARKVKPQYTEGDLVKVARAANQAEAEMIQGLLLEEGVPSMTRRSAGFDVPDFLAAGPRDVMVAASGAPTAREVLLQAEIVHESPGRAARSDRALLLVLAAIVLIAIVVWLGADVVG